MFNLKISLILVLGLAVYGFVQLSLAAKLDQDPTLTAPKPEYNFTSKYGEHRYGLSNLFGGIGPHAKINDLLIDREPTIELDRNIAVIKNLLTDEADRRKLRKNELILAEQLLNATKTIGETNQCSEDEHNTFSSFFPLLELIHVRSEHQPVDRLEVFLLQLFYRHAEECDNVYPTRFNSTIEPTPEVKEVEMVLRPILRRRIRNIPQEIRACDEDYFTARELYQTVISIKPERVLERKDIQALQRSLVDIDSIADQPMVTGGIANDNQYEWLINRYVVAPCRYYVDKFGPKLFIPASKDILIRPRKFSKKYGVTHVPVLFYEAWARYTLCEIIMSNIGTIKKLINLS